MLINNPRLSCWIWLLFVVLIAACSQEQSSENISTGELSNPVKAEPEPSPVIQMTSTPAVSPTVMPVVQKASQNQPTPTPTKIPPTPVPRATTEPQINPRVQQSTANPPIALDETRIVITEGSIARYLVQEQLARLDVPNDAIGSTGEIEGSILLGPDGAIRQSNSNIKVDLRTLESDKMRRDRHLRRNTYESDRFPYAEFIVREAPGLQWPLPKDGTIPIQLTGDMTIHGVTASLTWDGSVTFTPEGGTAQVRTNFPFETFDMKIPRLLFILSVEDNIRLELDLVLKVTTG